MNERVIGLALSGGGSRAAAFHLGCMRALHDRNLLDRIRVVSGISGGSLLAALWAYGPPEFADFEGSTTELLRRGLRGAILQRALHPGIAARNLATAGLALASRALGNRDAVLRATNRTDGLADALSDLRFGTKTMSDVTHDGVDVVLTATDLRTGNAVRFGSAMSSCSRYGTIVDPVRVATAVAASAAFPLLLPAIERTFEFTREGQQRRESVLLSDGGLYDNLGLSVLEPGRSSAYTPHVYDVSYIVSCDAGRGELQLRTPHFLPGRIARSFDIVHGRAQNAGRARLHEWTSAGALEGFVMAYLGMRDERLPSPIVDLVPRQEVVSYPTSFSPMDAADIGRLADRGEQLVRSLLPIYCSELI